MRKFLQEDDDRIFLTLFQLANNCSALGYFDRAEDMYNEILKHFEQKYGKNHKFTAPYIQNLANLYYHKRDLEKSKELNEKVIEIIQA